MAATILLLVTSLIIVMITSQTQTTSEPKSCSVEIRETRIETGTCIKLLGGGGACKSGNYLDPYNSDCN